MAILIGIAGIFQTIWAHLMFSAQVLGPFQPFFSAIGFNIWSFLAIYLIRKPGAGVIVKGVAAVIELMLGNPVGPVVLFYGAAEGFAADLAFVLFRRKVNLNMIIVGSLLAHFITLPVDMYRDAVPLTLNAVLTYTGPSIIGKVWISWLVFLALKMIGNAGIKYSTAPMSETNADEI